MTMKKMLQAIMTTTMFLCCSLIHDIQAQQRYFQHPDGTISDSVGFDKYKSKVLAPLQKINPDFSIQDEGLQLLRSNQDSAVYSFHLKMGMVKPASDVNSTLPGKLKVGERFPVMKLKTLSGETLDLNALSGKPTLINFWFAKCAPCIEEMPALGRIKREFGDKVQFLSVTYESPETVRKFLSTHALPFLHIPVAHSLIETIGVRAYPVNVFLDRDMIVRRIENGIPSEWKSDQDISAGSGTEFSTYLKSLLR
jgi:cytochrome c biogenesis protein CcmG, thiol:disulfide interchange protein DsbE